MEKWKQFGRTLFFAAAVWSVIVLGAVILHTWGAPKWQQVAAAVGALGGFLFGVPKLVPGGEDRADGKVVYVPNSNLEQVSDWLTKIIIGSVWSSFEKWVVS